LIEQKILAHLVNNESYARKVLPFVKPEYFSDSSHRVIYQTISAYVDRYNTIPSAEALTIDVDKIDGLSSDTFSKVVELLPNLKADKDTDIEWLLDQTEKYCQDRAVYNAIMESINIIDGKSKDKGKGSIPQILSEALAISFDTSVGHDFLSDSDSRYDFYHRKEEKVEFDLEYFNKITRGGIPRKTLNVALAGTGVGKTLFMCHTAAANLSSGYNVLYITMEMSEERIAERIDSNLLNVTTDELKTMPKDAYDKKIERVRNKCKGRLIIKEYPTSTAGSANFRHLLQELKLKRKFIPDIIYIDYLNICSSSRMKMGNSVNSYMYIKAIAEELRGLAVEYDVPIITATQTNRDGYNSSDVDLTNTSESFGLPATADLMFAIISTEELENLGQLMIKQLKNRYNDLGIHRNFMIGVDRSKMRLYDVEDSAQNGLQQDRPVMDTSRFSEDEEAGGFGLQRGKKDFSKLRMI
jgi:archaellum biogenesis ATPase FlaH